MRLGLFGRATGAALATAAQANLVCAHANGLAPTPEDPALAVNLHQAAKRALDANPSAWETVVVKAEADASTEGEPSWTAKVAAMAAPLRVAALNDPVLARSSLGANAAPAPSHSVLRLNGKTHEIAGIASYYWQDQMTATGERFNKRDLTAAHKTLPFGTRVRVTRLDSGKSVVVRINDRGPFKAGRVIDLSEKAAEDIGMTGKGLTAVRLEVVSP
jgi:rare lipoprotein A